MLFPRAQARPSHVAAGRVFDQDMFVVDAPDGDFAGAMARLRDSAPANLFWTPANRGHWVATSGPLIEGILSWLLFRCR